MKTNHFFGLFAIILFLFFIVHVEAFQPPNYEPPCPCQTRNCRGCHNCLYRNMCGKMGYNTTLEPYASYRFSPSPCRGGCTGNCNTYNSGKEMNILLPNETDCPYRII